MIRNSIVVKLWLTIVGMVVLVLALLSILLQQFFDNYVYQQQSRQLGRLATSVQAILEGNDYQVVAKAVNQFAYVQNAQIQFGLPYRSKPALAQDFARLSKADQQRILAGNVISLREQIQGKDTVSAYVSFPSSAGPGLLRVSQEISVSDAQISRMRNLILFAMALGVILTTGLAFVISKNLSRPLVQMNDVAEEMAKGNFDGKVNVVTHDEVGRLGRTLNFLAAELERSLVAISMEKDQLSSILSSLEDGVVATDLRGVITLANPPALRWLNIAAVMQSDEMTDTTALPSSMVSMFGQVVQSKVSMVQDVSWQGRNVVITMTPLYESDGERVRGVVAVLRDVTEERQLDRLRKDFVANVSHELRTPLSMMQGYTEALLDEFGDDPEQRRELTEIIHDETLRMRRLVNGLLDLAQLDSGQFQMSMQDFDIMVLLRKVARKFQTLANERGITFRTEWSEESILVKGDADRLEQVFTNLIDNAMRHTPAGGNIQFVAQTLQNDVQILVKDTGTGIPPDDLPYIWERFYKADKARTRGNSGTGLGLAITRYIVLEHKGQITVESQMGIGTTFRVRIPTRHDAA